MVDIACVPGVLGDNYCLLTGVGLVTVQLLIDFKYTLQPGGMHVDYATGKVTYS